MKKKSINPKPVNGKVISFSQRLNNPKQSRYAIEELRNIDDFGQINAIVRRAGELCKNRIFSIPMPGSYCRLKSSNIISNVLDESVIRWMVYEFFVYSSEINKFLELQNNFELAFLDGEYELAKEYLANIKRISVSLWSLENEFVLLQFSEGLHANLAYLSDLNKDQDVSIIIKIFAMFYSKKAEDNISPSKYKDEVASFVNYYQNNDYQDVYDYFSYKLLPDNVFGSKTKAIFRLESNSSIIDRYMTFKDVLRKSIYGEESSFKTELILAAASVASHIHDSELDNILAFMGVTDCQLMRASATKDFITICDLYTMGKYDECIFEATSSLKYIGNSFELYEIIAKSATFLGKLPLKNLKINQLQLDLVRCLFDIFKKTENYEASFRRLYKLSFTFSAQSWARQLYAVLLLDMATSENSLIMAEYLLQSKFLNPKTFLTFIDDGKRQQFIDNLLQEFSDSSTISLWSMLTSGVKLEIVSKIPLERQNLYFARFFMEHDQFDNAILLLENLICDVDKCIDNWYFIEKIASCLVNCYLNVSNYEKALSVFVQFYFINLHFKKRLKLDILLEGLEGAGKAVHSLSEYLIFLHVLNVDSYSLYVACDNFLVAHAIDRPSALLVENSSFKKNYLIYVYHQVFTESILSKLLAFNNTDEVEEERLHLLHRLIEIDEKNSSLYIKEMNEISIKSTVRKYIYYTNEGKIYVDIDGVKKYSNENLRERFDRYLEVNKISSENFAIIDIDSAGAIFYFKNSARRLYYIRDIRFAAFKSIFLDILGVFISSKEFGLNNYLSMRIRHGTLTGQLRKSFDDANLVSQKDSDDKYHDIVYWNENLTLPIDDINAIQECLKDFSRKVDEKINLVKAEWIQVKTEKSNSNGLFDYTFLDEEIFNYFKDIGNLDDWDTFLDKTIAIIMERTKVNLEAVKNIISNDLKYAFLQYLGELAGQVQLIDNESRCFKLISAITSCKTCIQTVLDKVVNWFEFSQDKKINQFDFELAIRASTFLIGNLYKQNIHPLIIKGCNSSVLFRGEYFNSFFDLLNILFENIVKHSCMDNCGSEIQINFNVESNKLNFSVENQVCFGRVSRESKERLGVIIRALQSDEAKFELTSLEGGSGILKIRKILQHDLRSSEWRIVPTLEDSRYKIEIETDISGIVYENIDN